MVMNLSSARNVTELEGLSAGEVCRALSIPYRTLDDWVRRKLIQPDVPAKGTGVHRRFSLRTAWAIGISRSLRRYGLSLDVAGEVLGVLGKFSEDYLQTSFNEGRNFLFIAGGHVMPLLVHENSITDNPQIRHVMAEARAAGFIVNPIGVNVRAAWDQLVQTMAGSKVERPTRRRKVKRKRAKTQRHVSGGAR
jgi:DNA-binding transcriptional MerR regulator